MTTKEEKMEILRLSDVPLQEVKWLWYHGRKRSNEPLWTPV